MKDFVFVKDPYSTLGDEWDKEVLINQDSSVSKSNWLYVDTFWLLSNQFEVYYIDFSKTICNFSKVLNFNQFFLKLNYNLTSLVRHSFIWHPWYYDTFLQDQTF